MSNQITVKGQLEGNYGYGPQEYSIRFWLEMEVNGKTIMSRGAVIAVEKESLADARKFARDVATTAQERVSGMEPKEAAKKLEEFVNEVAEQERELQAIFKSFDD